MKLHCIFAQRKESYPGEYGAELIHAVDEFDLENGTLNEELYFKNLTNAKSNKDFALVREIIVDVPQKDLDKYFCVPEIQGEIEDN